MLTTFTLVASFILWQLLYLVCAYAVRRALLHTAFCRSLIPPLKTRQQLAALSPAYVVSTLHALFVTPRGLQHLYRLFYAPISIKLLAYHPISSLSPHELKFIPEVNRVMVSNLALTSYLLADIVHVIAQYPRLGKWDTIAHHISFFYCGVISGYFGLYPFMFGWLIIGESSTPFLNLRWFLIKAGLGHTWLFSITQTLFALAFIITRFFVYTVGLSYQISLLFDVPRQVPRWAVYSTTSFVAAGFVLNMIWLLKIGRMAFQPRRLSATSSPQTPTPSQTDPSAISQANTKAIKHN